MSANHFISDLNREFRYSGKPNLRDSGKPNESHIKLKSKRSEAGCSQKPSSGEHPSSYNFPDKASENYKTHFASLWPFRASLRSKCDCVFLKHFYNPLIRERRTFPLTKPLSICCAGGSGYLRLWCRMKRSKMSGSNTLHAMKLVRPNFRATCVPILGERTTQNAVIVRPNLPTLNYNNRNNRNGNRYCSNTSRLFLHIKSRVRTIEIFRFARKKPRASLEISFSIFSFFWIRRFLMKTKRRLPEKLKESRNLKKIFSPYGNPIRSVVFASVPLFSKNRQFPDIFM